MTQASPKVSFSALYRSRIRHRRHAPRPHAFNYEVLYFYLDLSEIDAIFAGKFWMNRGRFGILSYCRSDYLGDTERPLDVCVRERVRSARGLWPTGPIRMLTQIRFFGFCFNPVTFYYCFDAAGTRVETIVAEITNTPWNERHAYVLECDSSGAVKQAGFKKSFHVSPFLPMDMNYRWSFSPPNAALTVHMENFDPESSALVFDVTVTARRWALTRGHVVRAVISFPLLTFKAFLAIHAEALCLLLKRVPFYSHPARRGSL